MKTRKIRVNFVGLDLNTESVKRSGFPVVTKTLLISVTVVVMPLEQRHDGLQAIQQQNRMMFRDSELI
jgi:hypothetical protein